jgi:hypothetical protein
LNHVFRNVKIIPPKNQILGIEKLKNYFIVAFIIINYLFGEVLLMKKRLKVVEIHEDVDFA